MSITNSTSSNPQSTLPYQANDSKDSAEPENSQIYDELRPKGSDPLVSEEMSPENGYFQIPKKKKAKTFLLHFTPIFYPSSILSTSPKIQFTPPDKSEIERDSPNKRESQIKSNRKISSGSSKEKLSPYEIGKIKKIQKKMNGKRRKGH